MSRRSKLVTSRDLATVIFSQQTNVIIYTYSEY